VNDIFNIRIKNRKDLTPEDVIYFAEYFGVSFLAMVYRLNNLKLLGNGIKEKFIKETWVTAVRKSMGISEPERGRFKFPSLYFHFCLKAYQQNKITTSRLAEFLELPLYQVMELGRKIKRSTQDEPVNTI
jgi:Zn-dependent peptidase ImmA (M78 family)